VAAVSVDFGAKDGHDFDQVGAKLLPVRFVCDFVEEVDFDATELADLEDDFTTEAEQAVLVG
jgi:hypothetical protein